MIKNSSARSVVLGMSLKSLEAVRKTTAFRLTLWYSSIFIFSSVMIFGLAYLLLSRTVREQDREIICSKMDEYVHMGETRGIRSLLREIRREYESNELAGFVVRVSDPKNRTLVLTMPDSMKGAGLDKLLLHGTGVRKAWSFLPVEGSEEVVELRNQTLANGFLLQLGKRTDEREDLLERFRGIFLLIMLPVVLVGLAAGSFLAFRSLRPIRDLIHTVREIDIGRMDARVPLRHTGDELDELVRLFNNMLEKIKTLITGMQDALDNVAHDLRTPATRMRAVTETVLQSECDRDTLREALMDCAEESERIVSMLRTLMDISEAETGIMTLHLDRVDIASLVDGVLDLYHYVAGEKGVSISASVPKGLEAQVDADRMRQVIANLLDNAVKYTPGGGRVKIGASGRGGEIIISVTDTGAGIPPDDLPRIFERLYRGDKSRSQRGLGLGLSLVQAVVHAHGGRIEVKSRPGEGSTFILHLPRDSV